MDIIKYFKNAQIPSVCKDMPWLFGMTNSENKVLINTKPSQKFSTEKPVEYDKEADAFFDKVIMKDLHERMVNAAKDRLPSMRIYVYNQKDKAPNGRFIDELVYENPTFLYRLQQLADKYPGICIERWNEHYDWSTQTFNKSIKAIWGVEMKKRWPF